MMLIKWKLSLERGIWRKTFPSHLTPTPIEYIEYTQERELEGDILFLPSFLASLLPYRDLTHLYFRY